MHFAQEGTSLGQSKHIPYFIIQCLVHLGVVLMYPLQHRGKVITLKQMMVHIVLLTVS